MHVFRMAALQQERSSRACLAGIPPPIALHACVWSRCLLLLYIIDCRVMHCSLNEDWRQRAH